MSQPIVLEPPIAIKKQPKRQHFLTIGCIAEYITMHYGALLKTARQEVSLSVLECYSKWIHVLLLKPIRYRKVEIAPQKGIT